MGVSSQSIPITVLPFENLLVELLNLISTHSPLPHYQCFICMGLGYTGYRVAYSPNGGTIFHLAIITFHQKQRGNLLQFRYLVT